MMRRTTKERIDRIAENIVKMRRGEFEYPEGYRGKRFVHLPNGEKVPAVNKMIAMRQGWGTTNMQMYRDIFTPGTEYNKYLEERIAVHEMRLSGGYAKALAELEDSGRPVTVLLDKLYDSLMADLTDPDRAKKIPWRDRARLYDALRTKHVQATAEAKSHYTQNVNLVVQEINVPDSVRQRIAQKAQEVIDAECTEER